MTFIRKYLNRKAQGIVEYALLLAFIAGLGMMLQGGGLANAVKGVFDNTAELFANIDQQNSYKTAFSKWRHTKRSELFGNAATSDERFQADLDALKIIAETIAANVSTKEDAAAFLNTNINKNELKYNENSPMNDGIKLLNYFDETGESDPNYTGNFINSTYYVNGDNEDRTISWLTGNSGVSSAYNTSKEIESYRWYDKYPSTDRYFYSDAMLFDSGSNEKRVMANFKFDNNNNVTGVHVFVKQYKDNEKHNPYLEPAGGSNASS